MPWRNGRECQQWMARIKSPFPRGGRESCKQDYVVTVDETASVLNIGPLPHGYVAQHVRFLGCSWERKWTDEGSRSWQINSTMSVFLMAALEMTTSCSFASVGTLCLKKKKKKGSPRDFSSNPPCRLFFPLPKKAPEKKKKKKKIMSYIFVLKGLFLCD